MVQQLRIAANGLVAERLVLQALALGSVCSHSALIREAIDRLPPAAATPGARSLGGANRFPRLAGPSLASSPAAVTGFGQAQTPR